MTKQIEGGERLIFGLIGVKTGRVCAGFLAVVFLTLTVCVASLPPDKFFAELSPQDRVDSIIRALEIIDWKDSCPSVLRSMVARALAGSGHCADISFIPHAGSRVDLESARDFIVPPASRAGGVDTVARE